MSTITNLIPKKDVARSLLLRGSVFVHLDPRRPGVLVPARLRNQAQAVLQIGLDMPVPIPDLRVDEEGIFGTLSFKGIPFSCFVPWAAVFALVGEDAKGMVWDADMPDPVRAELRTAGKSTENAFSMSSSGSSAAAPKRPVAEPSATNVVSLADWRAKRIVRT